MIHQLLKQLGFSDKEIQIYLAILTRTSSKDVSLKLFSNESAEEIKGKEFPRRKITFFSASEDFTGTIWINGDYVIMIVCAKRPHYLVEIYDEV